MSEQPTLAPNETWEEPVPPAAYPLYPGADQEIEAKFAVDDPAALADLGPLLDLAPFSAPTPARLTTDTYYDTPEFAFLRAGYGLRIRRTEPVADGADKETPGDIVTLKAVQSLPRATSQPPIHRRFEVEGPISDKKKATNPSAWPRSVRKQAKEVASGRPALHPILVLTQQRAKRWATFPVAEPDGVVDQTGAPRVELSLDTVTVLDPTGGEDTPMAQFAEVELELQQPQAESEALFKEMVQVLASRPGLSPAGNSKLTRGLILISSHAANNPTPTQGLRADQPMAEAGRVVWRQELIKMLLCEAGVRAGEDIEYVHDMRVATRRSRAAMKVFGPYFQKGVLDGYAKNLRKTARRLGAVRDLDVILDNLAQYLAKQPTKQQVKAQSLVDHWTGQRSKAQTRLLKWLDSTDYRRFVAEFSAFCLQPQAGAQNYVQPPGQPPVPHQVRHILPSAIWRRFEAVRAYETLFTNADELESIPNETLHKLRIDIKALRYTLDFAQHLLGPDGQVLLNQLKKLQSHLGDLNDAVVKAARLETLQQSGLESPFVARYIDIQLETAARLRHRFPSLWAQFNRPETRNRLGRVLARI